MFRTKRLKIPLRVKNFLGDIARKIPRFPRTTRRRVPSVRATEVTPIRREPIRRTITIRQIYTALALTLFESMGRRLARVFELERQFKRAGVNIHPVKYSAETLLYVVIAGLLGLLGYISYWMTASRSPIELVIGALVTTLLPIMIFTTRLAYVNLAISTRRIETENELPFFMAYIATMVRGGYSLEKILERAIELRVFRAIRKEAQRVLTKVKAFGLDPLTALSHIALEHPSSRFRDIFLGYVVTLRSGGDVVHYLETRTRELIENRANELKAIVGRLLSLLEIYVVFGVIVSLALFVFFAVSGAITAAQAVRGPGGSLDIKIDVTVPAIYNFIVMPAIGFAVIFAINLYQPRTPISYMEVYLTLISALPISLAISTVVFLVTSGGLNIRGLLDIRGLKPLIYSVSVFLITTSIPAVWKYHSINKKRRGLINAMADFLRDVSEIRKTGLSPEKCITLVSTRDYRTLTPIIQRVGVSLTLGLSLEEALRRALRGVKEWFVIAMFRFLVDSVSYGGGSPEVIDMLARFTHTLGELEEQTRKRMKTQVVLPYLGSILLTSTPVMLLYMLLTLAKIPVEAASPLITVLMLGSMINAYIMGLIAGKASETTLAAGFFHASILVGITTIASSLTLTYIGL